MLVARDRHPVIPFLESCFDVIQDEWSRVPPERLMVMPYRGLFTGDWQAFVIHHDDAHAENHSMGLRNAPLVPETRKLVDRIPGLYMAAWLRLGPQSHVHRHADELPVIRVHLSMTGSDGSWLRVADERVEYERGRCVGFDPNDQHEAFNPTDGYRDVFVLDILTSHAQQPI